DGEELIPIAESNESTSTTLPFIGRRHYKLRREGRFAEITKVSDQNSPYWIVRDKSGVTHYYGLLYNDDNRHVLYAETADGPKQTAWAINLSVDAFNNGVYYDINTRRNRLGLSGGHIDWDHFEVQSILYTTVQDLSGPPPIDPSGFQVGTNHPAFEVRFRRDLTHERADVPSSARAGIDVREPYLLQGLDVILHDPNGP